MHTCTKLTTITNELYTTERTIIVIYNVLLGKLLYLDQPRNHGILLRPEYL